VLIGALAVSAATFALHARRCRSADAAALAVMLTVLLVCESTRALIGVPVSWALWYADSALLGLQIAALPVCAAHVLAHVRPWPVLPLYGALLLWMWLQGPPPWEALEAAAVVAELACLAACTATWWRSRVFPSTPAATIIALISLSATGVLMLSGRYHDPHMWIAQGHVYSVVLLVAAGIHLRAALWSKN
jgi:hypothetical protein